MKNKGFTLMELLAVLIILAIIALIATPTVLNIIEDTRIKAAIQSAYGYIDAVNLKVSANKFTSNKILDSTYDILDENYFGVEHNGTSPTQGILTILNSNVKSASLCIMGYPIEYNDGTAIYDKNSTVCPTEYKFIEPEGTVIADLCNGGTYEVGSYKIKTVEDLVCFGKLVDDGNNFSGSTIMLLSDLDIKNKSTYKSADKISSYDINGNGVNESIYVELTTEKGFNPIGTDQNVFTGTFEGYGFNINNLYINRTSEDFIGLFASNKGTIQGLNINNVDIRGKSRVGGLAGHSTELIKEINISGNITGTGDCVGGLVGESRREQTTTDTVVTNVLVNADVSGLTHVGGIAGISHGYNTTYLTTLKGIMTGGSVKGNTNVGRIGGYVARDVTEVYAKSSIEYSTIGGYSFNGTEYNEESMLIYEKILDTYVGGDNDSSGYYFDYNGKGEFVVKSTAREPINNTLDGSGTEEEPYIIKSIDDWKIATATVKEGYYYKLASNLDFANKTFYPMGSISNYFTGNLNGNMYTIKNVDVEGVDYTGIFGYNTGNIEGINFENITLVGDNTIGIIGHNTGEIKGINVSNVNLSGAAVIGGLVGNTTGLINEVSVSGTVTGTGDYVGGIAGHSNRPSTTDQSILTNALANVEVTGNTYVGGLAGLSHGYNSTYRTTLKGIMIGGSVKGNTYVGRISGYAPSSNNVMETYAKSSIEYATAGPYTYNGTEYDEESMLVYEKILDTYVGGDNDSSGYYFDYDDKGEYVVKSIAKDPIKNTLDGSGTENDPYIIKSTDDWKIATSTVTEGVYYKLASNLDFANKTFYPMGSINNYFTGNLNGNMYTIKNVDVEGVDYTGIFGYNTGNIEGINFENITLVGDSNIGIIGYNTGKIQGINVYNANFSGISLIGGLVGYSNGFINEISVSGTVTGTGDYIGGLAGDSFRTETTMNTVITNVLVNADVSGSTHVGGIVGLSHGYNATYLATLKGIMTGGSVKGTTYVGRISGYAPSSRNVMETYAKSSIEYVTTGAYTYNGTSYDQDSLFTYEQILDTYIGGDNDSSGYYFDYDENGEFVVKSISRNPIKNTLQGSGTESNPYIIKSTDDWKVATSTAKEGYYYKLASDLDFANKAFYPMGSINSYFTGHLDGNMYTIKNVDIEASNYAGIFGYNAGVIEGINFENITITGGDYVGIIAYNTNTVLGINATNVDISGNKQVGGLVGYNSGLINEVNLTGKVSLLQTNYNVGGITGDNRKANSSEVAIVKNALVNVELSGNEAVGGIAGASESYSSSDQVSVSGILDGGSINGNKYTGKIIGYQWYSGINAYASSSVTMIGSGGNSGTSMDSTYVNNLEYYSNILDITDSDSSGYYFGYNSDSSDIVVLKAS